MPDEKLTIRADDAAPPPVYVMLAPMLTYRCRKGHVSRGDSYTARPHVCPECYRDMLERECGGMEVVGEA